jgi:hypothetical protein
VPTKRAAKLHPVEAIGSVDCSTGASGLEKSTVESV